MASKLFKRSNSKRDTIECVLPKDALLQVFSYLDVKSLSRCAQVSKNWNSIALDHSNWKNIDLSHFQGDDELDLIENIFYRWGGTIRQLSLRGCKSIDYSLIQTLAQSCHSIEVLNLSGCSRVNDIACRYLSVYCCRLTTLNLDSCSLITDEALKVISNGCVFMESLNISWCNQITETGIIHFAKECHMLRIFILKGCPGVTSNAVAALASNCPYLEVCNFFSCDIVDDKAVSRLARKCKSLRSICLSGCTAINDAVLRALADYCPNLNTLEVAKCRSLTDDGFGHLAMQCKKLKVVDLEECVITDRTLDVLGKYCPKLEQLCISKCALITNVGINMLSDGRCVKHLMVLEMHSCPLLTDECVEYLIKFGKMKRMELFECEGITKAGIEKLKNRLISVIGHSIDEGHRG